MQSDGEVDHCEKEIFGYPGDSGTDFAVLGLKPRFPGGRYSRLSCQQYSATVLLVILEKPESTSRKLKAPHDSVEIVECFG